MEIISKFRSFLAIIFCLAVCVNSAGKSKLKLKLNALDNLFRSELYLVNEKLDIGRKERGKLLEKFEETMRNFENRGKTLSDSRTEEEKDDLKILRNEIEKLSNQVEGNIKDTDALSGSLIRIRRGVNEEKVARKSDTNNVTEQLEDVQKNQIEIKQSQNEMGNIINSMVSNQNNIFNKLEEIATIQGDLMNKVNNTASQDSVGKLEVKLDKYSNEVLRLNQQVGTQITEVMSIAQVLESNITMISDNIEKVKENVHPKPYCKNQLSLDDCLEKHFRMQQDFIDTLRRYTLPIMLVGGDSPNEGRVEINHGGRRGTICDDSWDDRDAAVVCRMLGYTGGTALQSHSFGVGTGEILLDEVACNGNEKSLFDCKHPGIGVNDCGHREDAGVRCDEVGSNQNVEDYFSYKYDYGDLMYTAE